MEEKFSCLLPFVWLAYHSSAHLFLVILSFPLLLVCNKVIPWIQPFSVKPSIPWLVNLYHLSMYGILMMAFLVVHHSLFYQILQLFWNNLIPLGSPWTFSKVKFLLLGHLPPPLLQSTVPGFLLLDSSDIALLGSPITLDALPSSFESKPGCIQTLISCLESLFAHHAFYLLHHCFVIPKLLYLLHTSPSWRVSKLLKKFDKLILSFLQTVTNIQISSSAWALPAAKGGLRIWVLLIYICYL